MADYTQPPTVTRRVRFFDGQFLQDQDFIDEQKYHLDRQRRLGKVLGVTGVVEGLTVTTGGPYQVTVTAGTAIDGDGRQLVLAQDRTLDLPAKAFSGEKEVRVLIVYREQATELATTGGKSERRWLEDPLVVAVTPGGRATEEWDDELPPVVLAQLRLDGAGTVMVDGSVAELAGIRLPGSVDVGTAATASPTTLEVRGTIRFGDGQGAARLFADAEHFGLVDNDDKLRLVVRQSDGNVGIGTPDPRTALDTGTGVLSGAANDYVKAQFTMSGGGTVTWEGPGGRLKWTQRFIAISMERGPSFPAGHVNIHPPVAAIPRANVYDGVERPAGADGVVLRGWEALYAVHEVGRDENQVSGLHIRRYDQPFSAPSNWILVAVVNNDDRTVKLGTGVILSAKSSSSKGSPLPTGTILMWSGAADAIPEGWALCNGTNGTPDLRSRFLVGAGAGGSPEYAPGQSGNPDQHDHRVEIPNRALTTGSAGGHDHAPPEPWYDRSLLEDAAAAGLVRRNAIDRGTPPVDVVRTSTDGAHTHSITVTHPAFSSVASSGNNRPKWYALCFIMKL
jgi:hypothetical protein